MFSDCFAGVASLTLSIQTIILPNQCAAITSRAIPAGISKRYCGYCSSHLVAISTKPGKARSTFSAHSLAIQTLVKVVNRLTKNVWRLGLGFCVSTHLLFRIASPFHMLPRHCASIKGATFFIDHS